MEKNINLYYSKSGGLFDLVSEITFHEELEKIGMINKWDDFISWSTCMPINNITYYYLHDVTRFLGYNNIKYKLILIDL